MLYLDTALELEGVTLYRDYNAPNRFYYMPRSPHLSVEGGQPLFQLLIYRRDITDNPDWREGSRPGGGFLTMTVDIGVPQATLDGIRRMLGDRFGGQVDLAPVPFEAGTVRVSALGVSTGAAAAAPDDAARGPRFIENILGSTRPSLYGDNRAVFSMELSHEGAQLMRASLQEPGASQIAVVYDLEYKGLLPAYEVTITINFRQSYEYLRSRFTMNTLVYKTDIDNETERLVKDGSIRIQEVDYLGTAEPAQMVERQQRLTQLARDLATWSFFRPGLTPGNVLAQDRGSGAVAADPTTAAQELKAGFTEPLRAAGTGTGSPGDVSGPRLQGESANPSQTRLSGQPAPAAGQGGQGGQGGSGGQSGNQPLSAVEAWNRAGRPQAAYSMRQLSQEEQQTITFNLRQVSAVKRNAAPQGSIRVLGGAALRGRIKEIDLNDPFFERVMGTVTTSADLAAAGVTSMVVKLRYGVRDDGTEPKDSQEFTFTKAGDKGSYAFFMDRRHTFELSYQVVVSYKAGFAIGNTETQATSDWVRTSTRNLDIDPRVVGAVFPVALVPGAIDWSAVQSVQTTVIYDDPRSAIHAEVTRIITQGGTPEPVYIRPKDQQNQRFKVRSTYFFGANQEVVEVSGQGASTIVLNPPTTRAVPVSVTAVDPLGRFRKVTVELSYKGGEAEQRRLIELSGDGASASWTLFRSSDTAEARYRYKVTAFGRDGSTDESDWQETGERQLIVGDRFAGMLEVNVMFAMGDFASMGLIGARLKLEYPDAPAQADPDVERFFTGSPQPFSWRVPRKKGGGKGYRYTVQWVRLGGATQVVGPLTSEDETLLIFPPMGG